MSLSLDPMAHALAYAARGLRVLPIREREKLPLTVHGVNDASSDVGVIREWWARWPRANVGIAVPPHWTIVDVDVRADGFLHLSRLVAEHGPLPATVTAETGSGGAHYIYERDPALRLAGKLCPGVDLLSVGRYFLAAPSLHPCGGRYRWLRGATIAPLPAWIAELARVRDEAPSAPHPSMPRSGDTYARAAAYVASVPGAVAGQGGHAATFVLAQRLVRGFELSDGEALALMRAWNELCQPRWGARDLARKVREARARGTMPVGSMTERRR